MADAERGTFKNVVHERDAAPPRPVDEYLAELDRLIAAHDYFKQDKVIPAIGRGAASREVVQRLALEFYYLGKWMTPEFALLVANAPDAYAFTMDASQHYHHWAQNLADEAGYLRDPNHVQMKVAFCRQLGLTDDDVRAYRPLPETIAMTCTILYYIRRSYEEGLAVFGYAGERVAAGSGYARTLYEGLQKHYGLPVKNFEVCLRRARARRQGGGHLPPGRDHARRPGALPRGDPELPPGGRVAGARHEPLGGVTRGRRRGALTPLTGPSPLRHTIGRALQSPD